MNKRKALFTEIRTPSLAVQAVGRKKEVEKHVYRIQIEAYNYLSALKDESGTISIPGEVA